MPADLIIYAVIAGVLVFWLRSILGTRHGEERQRPNPMTFVDPSLKKSAEADLAIEEKSVSAQDGIIQLALHPTPVFSIDNKSAENGLLEIAKSDKNFEIKFFLSAAQDAFAIVVEAFAAGDRETLKDLLEESVYSAFESGITQREKDGITQVTDIHSVRQAQVIEAKMQGKKAMVTVRFKAEQTSIMKDKDGKIIDGDANKISRMIDIWTFARDVKSKDPRWFVAETRGDFDEDNDLIPDTH